MSGGLVKGLAVMLHTLPDHFQECESPMRFVQMIDAWANAQGGEGSDYGRAIS
jgi:hypothetical protein